MIRPLLIGFATPWLGLVALDLTHLVVGGDVLGPSSKVPLQLVLTLLASVLAGWLAARSDHHDPPRHHLLALGGIVLFAVVVVAGSLRVVATEPRDEFGPPVSTLVAVPLVSLAGGGAGVALHDVRRRGS